MENEATLHDYLNGALPSEALEPLDKALSASSALADELADLSRIEVLLTRHYGGSRSSEEVTARLFAAAPTSPARTGRIVAVAVIALCGAVLAVVFWPRSKRPVTGLPTSSANSALPAVRRPVVRTTDNGTRSADQRATEAQAAQLRQILSGFYLPAIDFKEATLDKALAELEAILQELDHLRRPELRSVRLQRDKSPRSGAPESPPRSITLRADNVNFLSVLRAVAARAEHDIEMRGDTIVLSPRVPVPDGGNIFVRDYLVPPMFLALGGIRGDEDERPAANPAVPDEPATAEEILARAGVSFPPGTSAKFDPVASKVTVRYPESGMEFIDALLGDGGLFSTLPPLVKVSGYVLEWAGGALPADQVMGRDQFDEWWSQKVAQQPAAQSLAWPTVIAHNAQTVSIDSVNELFSGNQLADWQGTRILLLPVREGEVVRLGGILDVRASAIANQATQPQPGEPVAGTPPADHGIEFEALVGEGQVAVISFGSQGGTPAPIVAAFRVNAHSPSGEVIDRTR